MIDLSHAISPQTPAFPGDPAPRLEILDSTNDATPKEPRHLNCSYLGLSLHCGTHMDAPFHFFGDRATIDRIPLDRCVGPAVLIRLQQAEIDACHLEPFAALVRTTRRAIFNTSWHRRWGEADYFTAHPVLTGSAAQFLVDCGAVLVGVDFPSVDRAPYPAHLVLLGQDVLIVENLTNLELISRDVFTFAAIPLKIAGRDGSPVRALALD